MRIKIENWSLVGDSFMTGYIAPEMIVVKLNGDVTGHPRFKDGENITTSKITGVKDGAVEVLSGNLYILGKVSDDYAKAFPNYQEILDKIK